MTQCDPLDSWPEFIESVRNRLEQGREAYRDEAFTRPPEELAREIEQELFDVCGWAFILWCRIAAIRLECPNCAYKAFRTDRRAKRIGSRGRGQVIVAPGAS